MTEPITVEAEVIEPETTAIEVQYTPATIQNNLAVLSAYVDKQLEIYRDSQIDPEDYEQIKGAKAAMAALNKLKKPIDDERKRIKREYEAPLKAFEAEVKEITGKIDDARNAIKEQVDEADRMFKENRRAFLQEEYLGCAGAIANVLDFDAMLESKWLNRSFNEVQAVNELYEKTSKALEAYNTLQAQKLNHPDEVVKKFADTLDLTAALKLEEELNERDREMEAFKAAQAEAEAVKAERESEPDEQPAPILPEPEPEPIPEPEPMPAAKPAANAPVFCWVMEIAFTGTEAEANAMKPVFADFANHLQGQGIDIKGRAIKCKGVANG